MIRTFLYRLYPTGRQERILLSWLTVLRWIYNAALQERRDAYRLAGKSIGYNEQTKEITQLRAEDAEYAAIPVEVLRSPLKQLKKGFDGFFRRCKTGEKPGFPRFRGRDRFSSFSFGPTKVNDQGRVWVFGIGWIRLNLHRPVDGVIKDGRIIHRNGRWYVSFQCYVGEAPAKVPVRNAVGIDLGLTHFAVLSDGTEIPNPRFFKESEALIARRQQALARKRRGSKSRQKAKRLVGRAHEKVTNQRLDFARKTACDLYDRYDLVVHEDLTIARMIRAGFSKSISDVSWGATLRCLSDKAEYAGRWLIAVDPRGTSQRCSRCQATVQKELSERTHSCPNCGLVLGPDHNAAINILALGASAASNPKSV